MKNSLFQAPLAVRVRRASSGSARRTSTQIYMRSCNRLGILRPKKWVALLRSCVARHFEGNAMTLAIRLPLIALALTTIIATAPQSAKGSDLVPPTAPTNVAATQVTPTSALISWSPSTDNVGVTQYAVSLQGIWAGLFAAWATPPSTTAMLINLSCDTNYGVKVVAVDGGNNMTYSTEVGFRTAVCSTALGVEIIAPFEGDMTAATAVNLEFVTTGSPDAVECRLDAGPATTCASPRLFSNLSEGNHTFAVTVNKNGGGSVTAIRNVLVDSIPPTISITQPLTNATVPPLSPVRVSASDATSGVVSLTCRFNSGNWSSCPSTLPASLSSGSHSLEVKAIDRLNRTSVMSRRFTVLPLPGITISSPTNGSYVNSKNVSFSTSGTVSSVTCKLDGGTASPCSSPKTYSSFSEGRHTVVVTASNAAGSRSASTTFTVDTVAPTYPTFTEPAAGAILQQNVVEARFAAQDTGSGVQGYECGIDSNPAVSCSSPFSTGLLGSGSHTVKVQAIDRAGNRQSGERSFIIGSLVSPSGTPMPVNSPPGWRLTMTEDFLKPQVEGDPTWHSSDAELDTVYVGSTGTKWTSYPASYLDTKPNQRPYRGDQVLSTGDGMLRFHLRSFNGVPAGASIAPELTPGGGRPLYQTYGRFSIRAKLRDSAPSNVPDNLGNYKVAWLLWPHHTVETTDWWFAESDYPEGGLGPGDKPEGYHHYEHWYHPSDPNQDRSLTEPAFKVPDGFRFRDWHTYTQEWRSSGCLGSPVGMPCRSYYIDDIFVGSTQRRAYDREERWQIQTETDTSTAGEVVDPRQEGFFEVDWAVAYKPTS